MELLFNDQQDKNHLAKIQNLIPEAEEIILCSGWIKIDGLELISKDLEIAAKRGAKITVISNSKHTKGKTITSLKKLGKLGVNHICVDETAKYFHTKFYYFQSKNKYHAIIGSANLTKGALLSNEELSVLICGEVEDAEHKKLNQYLRRLNDAYKVRK
jgi:HKD family nuclease